jgi:hypothetical protein
MVEWLELVTRFWCPERVQFAGRDYAHVAAHWVRFDTLTPGTTAHMDAQIGAKNRIKITARNTTGLTLLLKGHPLVSPKALVRISVDGDELSTRWSEEISIARTAKGWTLQRHAPAIGEKRAGVEGPIADAMSARHIYVYGTGDAAAPEEIERRRAQAAYAAEWSTRQSRLLLTFKVVADAELKDSDIKSANLVLFGTRETNTAIARLAPRLPIALNPGAADYSLTYVYPADSRYVLINSGLPWWTRADQVERGGMPFLSIVQRTAMSFGDFILFRGGLDNVVTEGRFNNDWNLPGEAAEKMRATQAIKFTEAPSKPAAQPKPRPVKRRGRSR